MDIDGSWLVYTYIYIYIYACVYIYQQRNCPTKPAELRACSCVAASHDAASSLGQLDRHSRQFDRPARSASSTGCRAVSISQLADQRIVPARPASSTSRSCQLDQPARPATRARPTSQLCSQPLPSNSRRGHSGCFGVPRASSKPAASSRPPARPASRQRPQQRCCLTNGRRGHSVQPK